MPCKKCKDGKYKWGNTGECKYATKDECEKANPKKYSKMKNTPTPLGKKTYAEYEKELKEFNLSNVEKYEFKNLQTVEKAISQANNLGDGASEIKNSTTAKTNYDKLGKEYDNIEKELKKLNQQQDKLSKPLSKAEDNFRKSQSELAQLQNELNASYDKIENARNLFEQGLKRLGINKMPPIIKEATVKMNQIDKNLKLIAKSLRQELK
jgi:chromosome segregation ATPase